MERWTLVTVTSIGAVAGILLVWLVLFSRGFAAPQARALWLGTNAFSIGLKPARQTVLRRSAVIVSARLNNFTAPKAQLFGYSKSGSWKRLPMLPGFGGSEFTFSFTGISESAEFYAKAEGVRSPVSVVKTVDLPRVRHISVSYIYPSEIATPSPAEQTQTDGDIIAPIGTVVKLSIETDRTMIPGQLVVEPGDSVDLTSGGGNNATATVRVLRDGRYHISVEYEGELVQIGDEHEIEVPAGEMSHRKRPAGPVNDIHTGPVPVGYERAVASYYKQLSKLQGGNAAQ